MERTGVFTDYLFSVSAEDVAVVKKAVLAFVADKQQREGRSQKPVLFFSVDAVEPTKHQLNTEADVREFVKQALACVVDSGNSQVYEIVVTLSTGEVARCDHIPNAQPVITDEDCFNFEEVCKASPLVRKAIEARGVKDYDPQRLQADPISSGYFGDESERGKRLSTGFCYYMDHELDNGYAHPIAGLAITVDLNALEIFKLIDHDPEGKIPIPSTDPNVYDGTLHQWYSPLLASQPKMELAKPLDIVQRDGPSFELGGLTGA